MSLDVWLVLENDPTLGNGPKIFVREGGRTVEITREEWDERYPGREPVYTHLPEDSQTVFSHNITHNLNKMADEAGIYEYLWRPDEIGITRAEQLIEPLENGLALLLSDPRRFREHNPPNGWGDYGGLVDFVSAYLLACRRWPKAKIDVSR